MVPAFSFTPKALNNLAQGKRVARATLGNKGPANRKP